MTNYSAMRYDSKSKLPVFREQPFNKRNSKQILTVLPLILIYITLFVFILKKDVLPQSKTTSIVFENGTGNIPVGEIVENSEIIQTFKARDISGISLNLATYARTNTGILNINVVNVDTGENILNVKTDLQNIQDNTFHSYYFDSVIHNEKAVKYQIIVTADGTYKGNAVTIWSTMEDSYPEGQLIVDGIPRKGDLSFKLMGGDEFTFILNIYIIAAGFILIFILFIYYLIFIKKSSIEKVFLPTAIFVGILYMLLLQPGVVPDEPAHINTAYRYSNVMLLKGLQTENGGMLKRKTDIENWYVITHPSKETYKELLHRVTEPCGNTDLVETTGHYVKSSPLLYLFSGLGITFARILHLGTIPLLYLGRLFNLLFFIIMTYLGMKKMPFGKPIMFVVSLFPMTMQEAASFSYDAVVNGLAFCFIGYCLNLAFHKGDLNKKDLVILFVLGVLLAPSKYIYIGICLLILVISKNKFTSDRIWKKFVSIFTLCAIAFFIVINLNTAINRVSSQTTRFSDTPTYTLKYIFCNPLSTVKLFINTFFVKNDIYIGSIIGNQLGWFQIPLPWILVFGFIILFIFSCFREKDEPQFLTSKNKILLTFICLSVVFLAFLSMMLIWTPNTFPYVEGVQGRYFLPIIPLLGLIFRNSIIVLNKNIDKTIMFYGVILQVISMMEIFRFIIAL